MSRLRRVTGRQVLKALQRAQASCWFAARAAIITLRHPDGRATVVPVHAGEILGPGLLNQILKDAGIERGDFDRLL